MQNQNKKRKPYETDITDDQWELIAPLIPKAKSGGRNRETDMREVVNAIFYLLKSGCTWRLLPNDFPHWRTVYDYFRNWKRNGTWKNIHDSLRDKVRFPATKQCLLPNNPNPCFRSLSRTWKRPLGG